MSESPEWCQWAMKRMKDQETRIKELEQSLEGLRLSTQQLENDRERLREAKEVIADLVNQFAYEGRSVDGCPTIYHGGLSALESAWVFLGYETLHKVSDRKCEMDGCVKHATCGTNTKYGYKRICGDHYQALLAIGEGK